MATDRPGNYVGNHGGAYTDINGMSKQFTYIDHDKKSKMSKYIKTDSDQLFDDMKKYKDELINNILAVPAVFAHTTHYDYTTRVEDVILWNDKMIKDEGISIDRLMDIYTLSSKRQDFHKRGITP